MRKAKDITGMKFNRLTAVKMVGKTLEYKQMWLFSCECGGSKTIESYRVTSGATKSCGCIKSKDKNFMAIENQAFGNHKRTATHKGLDWFLSKQQYLEIARKPCVYCGDISVRKSKSSKASMPLNSVDRKDNEPYYTVENCQSVCFRHQSMKSSLSHFDFIKECARIIYFLERNK